MAQILIHGLNGRIEVMGKTYQGAMPAFGTQLNDAEIAAVLTHIRTQLGNQAASVTEATVVAGRQASAGRALSCGDEHERDEGTVAYFGELARLGSTPHKEPIL